MLSPVVSIGKRNNLKVLRHTTPGIYLDGLQLGDILLPRRYVPQGAAPGDYLDVFVYHDSEDRLVATTEIPRATVGELAHLKVVSTNRNIGAFLDWGLSKDLLLPFREQTRPLRVGQVVLVRIYLDEKTHRIVASMKCDQDSGPTTYRSGQKVQLLITEKTPLGYKALVEDTHPGLLYHEGTFGPLAVGTHLSGFVRGVRPDGKLDLTLNEAGYRRVASLALRIVAALERNDGRLALDDDSTPEAIRAAFGASKKAFKQALGSLYRSRRIRFSKPGIELLDNSTWSPGK
jgi:predicted RNA-binding protein (virulence factor B family)